MKRSSFGKIPLIIGMATLLTSCDQKEKPKNDPQGAVTSTAELARENRFSKWTSKAGLQFQMEHLPSGQFFATVEGRLKDGANEYRAITESFDGETYRKWDVFWGLNEKELFDHEIALLRAGFERHQAQIYTDSSGVALHQLVMLCPMGAEGSQVPAITRADEEGMSEIDESLSNPPIAEPVTPVEPEPEPDIVGPEVAMIEEFEAPEPEVEPLSETFLENEGSSSDSSDAMADVTAENTDSPTEIPVLPNPIETADPPEPADPPVAVIVEEPEPEPEVEKPEPEPEVEKPEPEPEPEVEKPEPEPEPKPEPKPETISYKVVKGDTLSGIARRYNVRISDIKRANGLRSDIIRLRQVLKIPRK